MIDTEVRQRRSTICTIVTLNLKIKRQEQNEENYNPRKCSRIKRSNESK